jgi:hypothetical protein
MKNEGLLREGLQLLLDPKKEQYKKVVAETNILFLATKRKKANKMEQTVKPQFVLISKRRNVVEQIKTAIEKANLSVNLVLSWKRFRKE